MGITERKEREKRRRRNEIIDAAEKVFFGKGVENATMDDVAETAELSKGTLYLYFSNKEELLYAIKMRATVMLKEYFEKTCHSKSKGIDNVRNIGRAFINFSTERKDYFELMMHFEGKKLDKLNFEDPYIHEFVEQNSPMNLFIDIIKMGQDDGSVRDDIPPWVIAHNLWAMTTGVLQMITKQEQILEIHGYNNQDKAFIEGMFQMFENGITNNR